MIRQKIYQQLFIEARKCRGLSACNRVVFLLIIISVIVTIIATERELDPRLLVGFDWFRQIAAVIFTLEYTARVYAAGELPAYKGWRGRLVFMVQPSMLIDLFAIGPELIGISDNTLLARIARIGRIIRLARLGPLSTASAALAQGLRERRFELVLSIGLALGMLIASATVMYWVEGEGQPEHFGSIPRALWWSVATLTTVGYGDVVPLTPLGKLFAGITAILAIGLVAMPAGIFAAAFSAAFQRERERREKK